MRNKHATLKKDACVNVGPFIVVNGEFVGVGEIPLSPESFSLGFSVSFCSEFNNDRLRTMWYGRKGGWCDGRHGRPFYVFCLCASASE